MADFSSAVWRTFAVAELRDMVFKEIACPRTFCKMQIASREVALLCDLATTSLYNPCLLASHFFPNGRGLVDVVRECRAIITGSSVRQFMYQFGVRDGWFIIMVNEQYAERFYDFITSQGYTLFDNLSVERRSCRAPLAVNRFSKDGKYVTVQLSLHEPIRLLLATTRQVLNNLHPDTFSLERQALDSPVISFIERWIGDGNTWIPRTVNHSPSHGHLELHGWTIRLYAQRVTNQRVHHFWTDTASRCVRHELLKNTYVAPAPAMIYVVRVLDRMLLSLKGEPRSRLHGFAGEISDYDDELRHILRCFRADEDYSYIENGVTVTVQRLESTDSVSDN
ncbi:hypothetical protein AURDEDRAFT_158422 [Auricularia subglabra TFB-10046 SS5]|nr:hypothetical protein AURDEDRAFT_158422 [Auricularia subglabra TFB-10046 SS5]